MGTSVYFNNQGATREQFLVEDLVIESIKNHGIDVFYIPRSSRSSLDELFGDDPVKSFDSAYPMEMYLETFNDFEGNQEFFSKFGLEVQKNARVALARRTFEKYLPTTIRNTPKEGDLIWLPVQLKLMEITFVEQEKNFFQLGKSAGRGGGIDGRILPYMYGLELQLFKYNGEFFNTGILEIDAIQDSKSFSVSYTMQAGGFSTFEESEQVYQGASLQAATATAYVAEWDRPNLTLKLRNIKGAFSENVAIVGVTSGASWTMVSGNTQENSNETFDDNFRIESEADDILDWTELNPFGTPDE
jgi:hypothetical protein